jgi:hypothetical protein
MRLSVDPVAIVQQLGGDTGNNLPTVSGERSLSPVDVSIELFDKKVVRFASSSTTLTTLPIFDSNLRIVEYAQVLSWRSSTGSNRDSSTAAMTLTRMSSHGWQLDGGFVESALGDFDIRFDAAAKVTNLSVAAKDVENDSGPDTVSVRPVANGLQGGRGRMARPQATPPAGTTIDVMGVSAYPSSTSNLSQSLSYLADGLNITNTALANSSSVGFETENANVRLVGMVAINYTPTATQPNGTGGASEVEVLRLAGGYYNPYPSFAIPDPGNYSVAGNVPFAAIPALRLILGADVVVEILANKLDTATCGISVSPGSFVVATNEFTNTNCSGRKTIPHELGHTWNAQHDGQANVGYNAAWPANRSGPVPTQCSVVHYVTNCRGLVYSTPNRVFPGSANAAGAAGTMFNARVISENVVASASRRTPPVASGGTYTAISPARILDSRPGGGTGGYTTPWAAGETRPVSVAANGGVPATATAVILNVTVTGTAANGWLTVYPYNSPIPGTSTTNYVTGQTRAATTIVPMGRAGQAGLLNIYASSSTHVIIDVMGYFGGSSSTSRFASTAPTRVFDSRPASALQVGVPRTISVTPTVPTGAVAAVVNITADPSGGAGFLGLTASTSILNFDSGPIANLAVVPVSGGAFTLTAGGAATHVIVDVLGFLGPTGTKLFTPLTQATRVVGGVALAPGASHDVGSLVPANASAFANVTLTNPGGTTYVTTYANNIAAPSTSTVNIGASGVWNSNHTVVGVGPSAVLRTTNGPTGSVNYLLDIEGYFS